MELTGTATFDPSTGNGGEQVRAFPVSAPFAKQLLTAMLALRDGDFAARMPAELTDLDGKIADTFNEIAALAERRSR